MKYWREWRMGHQLEMLPEGWLASRGWTSGSGREVVRRPLDGKGRTVPGRWRPPTTRPDGAIGGTRGWFVPVPSLRSFTRHQELLLLHQHMALGLIMQSRRSVRNWRTIWFDPTRMIHYWGQLGEGHWCNQRLIHFSWKCRQHLVLLK